MFGANSGSGFSFGGGGTTNSANGGLFGNNSSNNNTSNTQSRPNIFGNSQAGANSGPGMFSGLTLNNTNQLSGQQQAGLFGNNSTTGGSLFGNTNNGAQQNTNLFGNKPANATTGTGLFGNKPTNTSNGGLFGNSGNTTTSGGLFGNNSTNGALTGNTGINGGLNGSNTNSGATGGLFGNNSTTSGSTGGLFGNNTASNNTNGGLFGNNSTTNNTNGGLFGNNSTNNNTNGGLFGNSKTNGTSGGLFGNSGNSNMFGNQNGMTLNKPSIDNDPYGMSKLTSTTVKVGDLMPSITEGPIHSAQVPTRPKRSSTVGSSQSLNNSTIIKNLSNQIRMRNATQVEDVSGIFSPIRNSIVEKFVPPTTTVGSIKSGKNFKQILASSKLDEIKKLINKRKYGSQLLIESNASSVIEESQPKKRKVNADGLILDELKPVEEPLLLEQNTVPILEFDIKKDTPAEIVTPILPTRDNTDGYWCLPSIEELQQMSLDHLANVEDFIIGRKGFGQIAFNYSVDLTTFKDSLAEELFGKVVQINDKTVQVYGSPYSSPEVGTGINVPATITLENLAPLDANTKSPILEPARPEVKDLIKKLKKLRGMQFISYDPFVGTWVFQVGHFSIWGLVDSENEADPVEKVEVKKALPKKDLLKQEEVVKEVDKVVPLKTSYGTRSLIEDTFGYKIQKNNDSQPTAVIPGGWSFAPIPNPDTSAASLMHKRSQYRPQTPEIESDEDDSNDSVQKFDNILEPESPPFDEDDIEVEIDSNIVDEKAYEPKIDEIDMAALEITSKFATSKDWLEQLTLSSGAISAFNTNSSREPTNDSEKSLTLKDVDDLLFKDFKSQIVDNQKIIEELRISGQTFIQFTSNGTILTKTNKLDTSNMSGVVEVSLKDKFPAAGFDFTKKLISRLLDTSTIVKRGNGFPQVMPNPELTFVSLLLSFDGSRSVEERNQWDLCSRLFDNGRISNFDRISATSKLVEIKRKQLVSAWFKDATVEEASKLLRQNQMDPLETIFIHVLANNIVKAVEVAIETNNNHLAVLLTLLGSNDSHVKESCQNQLDEWQRTNASQFIPKPILKIYLLLAELSLTSNSLKINLIEGLSWKMAFSLMLNYTNKSVNESIREFEKLDFKLEDDIYFQLMRLHTYLFDIGTYDLLQVFSRLGQNTKFKWFLYEILVRSTSRLNCDDKVMGDRLTLEFAEQLELQGLFTESLFVLSHLSSDQLIQQRFYELVTRHIFDIIPDLSDVSVKQRLIQKLHVPRTLISELISLRYRYSEEYWNEVQALIDARFWQEASSTVVKYIAPQIVIGNNSGKLQELALLINKINVEDLVEYNSSLGIYSNYIRLLETAQSGSNEELIAPLQFLIENLSKLPRFDESKLTKTACIIMSRKIGDILMKVDDKYIKLEKILTLPMGESELSLFRNTIPNDDKDVILD